jgi:hypothetical protein
VADWSIAKQYMDLVSRGVRAAIVLESRAGDKAYLTSRGIEELIEAAVGRSAITRNQNFSAKCDAEETVATQRTIEQRILRKAMIQTSA